MSADTIRVLVVCDDEQEFILLRERFSRIKAARYEPEWQSCYDQALNGLADNRHDVCMVDYRLGAAGGVKLIRAALERGSAVPMILLTGQGSHEVEMDAIGSGAMDFLTKQEIGGPLLESSLRYAVERAGRLNALRQSEARRQPAVDAGRSAVERNRELLETNKSLETAREQLAAALNSMSDAFVLYDARERLVVCNSKYRQLYPASAHLMVQGAKFEDIIRHVYESGVITSSGREVEGWVRARLARFRNPGPAKEYELADGRWLLVEENRTAEGGVVGIRKDITERKRAEEKLRQQQMQLIHADKMASLGVLVAGVAHEINNPNTAIMLNVPLLTSMWEDILPVLEQYDRENPNFTICNLPLEQARLEIPRLLAGISGGSQRVKHTVDNLKNFGRLNENREMNRISINDVVELAVSLLKSQINKYTDRFSVKYGSRIPQFDGDFQEIEQVVINLINNACQALTDRNREVCVATIYDSKSRKIKVEVVDEGAGIAGEILDKIMDPFFTTKGDAGGTGLGLSVSYGILKEHRGSLEIASTVGSGTKATMILPPA